jgi:hypothetical protein
MYPTNITRWITDLSVFPGIVYGKTLIYSIDSRKQYRVLEYTLDYTRTGVSKLSREKKKMGHFDDKF